LDTFVIINSSLEETPGLGPDSAQSQRLCIGVNGGYSTTSSLEQIAGHHRERRWRFVQDACRSAPHDEVMELSQDVKLRMRIAVVTVYVTDQDKAKAFYSETLGFEVKDDQPYGPGFRWLTAVSPMDSSTELYLAHQDRYPGARTYREAMYEAGTPTLGLAVDDIQVVHQRLTAAGVRFTRPITEEVYGGVGASIDDGCGNILNLHQDA
jgi:catechol 2,3-dioxygenase-like lactoylglutathione lyase family enzyme